jgi:hypothetical protein
MQRMCGVCARIGLLFPLFLLAGFQPTANGDLIRAAPGRTFPDIAGDIGGSQTYVYDPSTQTGTFALVNAPHLISLGPSVKDLVPLQPDRQGTLYQALQLKLDRSGRLIESPLNKFEIRGTVIINDQIYEGVLLEGKPIAFEIAEPDHPVRKNLEVFGLNVQIESGKLADTFGREAYLRIIPQANNTFRGEFTCDFSGEKPLTNLIALDQQLSPVSALGSMSLLAIAAVAICLILWRMIRWVARSGRRCPIPRHRPVRRYATPSL